LPAVDATVLEMTSEEQSGLPLVIRFPSDEEDARIKRFTVHRNYLGSIELFLAVLYGTGRDQAANLVTAQRALPAFQRIQRRATADERELRRLLGISWASELQLRLANIGGDVFLRYSNAWTPVQAYYAVYMSIHAWLSTAGMGHIDDHTGTLRAAVRHLVEARLLPHPWDVNCSGSPELGERAIAGAPANANIDAHFENLSAPSLGDFYPRLAKMLETTRDNRLQRNRREWLAQHKRKAMKKEEKRSLAASLHATTLFDYLWRLRIRANYGDVSTFLMSGVEDRSHGAFHAGLVSLTAGTCLLLQSLIVARVGQRAFASALDEFVEGGGVDLGDPAGFLRERRALLTPKVPSSDHRAPFAPLA